MNKYQVVFIGAILEKHYFIEYIDSILANCSFASVIWINDICDIEKLNLTNTIIVHIQHLFLPINTDSNNIHVMLNTESVRHKNYLIDNFNNYPHIDIIDHSIANITDIMKQIQIKNIYHIPYQINPKEILGIPKPHDIIMQKNNTERRIKHAIPIANKMNEYLDRPISFIDGWGPERDINIFNHKILVSINSYDNMSQISCFRTDRCVFNKMIVIQEIPDQDIENLNTFVHPELQKLMIFEKISNIYDRTIHVLENYNEYYYKIFNGIDFDDLRNKLKSNIDHTFASIEHKYFEKTI